MHELFFQKFNEIVPLTKEETKAIAGYLVSKKLRKKQFLLQESDICRSIAFVESGVLRSYTVSDKGTEHIIQFAPEGWLIADLYSFLTGEAATYNIDAIEHAQLLLISKDAHEEMLRTIPKYTTFTLHQITGAYLAMQRRLTSIISLPLEERYTYLASLYPAILQRVPQHMIASYMGLTPETLSRVRKRIANK